MSTARCDRAFVNAFRVLARGFPLYAECEFERARRILSPPIADDLAHAIVSDSVLVLSQLGAGVLGRCTADIDLEKPIVNILAVLQSGDSGSAARALERLFDRAGPAHLLSLQVLARRLTIAGVELRSQPSLRVIAGGRGSGDGGSRDPLALNAGRLRLVSST